LRLAQPLLARLRRLSRVDARPLIVLVGIVLLGVSGCSQSAEEVGGGPAGIGFTEFVVEVRAADGAPVEGARVRIEIHFSQLGIPHRFGPVSSTSAGRVTLRDRFECCGWVPATVLVDPPDGSSHFRYLPAPRGSSRVHNESIRSGPHHGSRSATVPGVGIEPTRGLPPKGF